MGGCVGIFTWTYKKGVAIKVGVGKSKYCGKLVSLPKRGVKIKINWGNCFCKNGALFIMDRRVLFLNIYPKIDNRSMINQ